MECVIYVKKKAFAITGLAAMPVVRGRWEGRE